MNLKGLDGIQGPFYVGTGCFFNRKALYGYDPPLEPQCCRFSWGRAGKKYFADGCGYAPTLYLESNNLSIYNMELSSLEMENPSLFLSSNQFFGQSPTLIASIIVKDDRFSTSATREDLLKEAIHVISCDYEENTSWGREISDIGSISLTLVFISITATGLPEMRWSGVGAREWWRSQQFWVIGGVSSHLFAVIYGPMKILMGKKANLTENDLKELYAFRWTALLILPTTIILISLCAMVSGISSAINSGYGSWGLLLVKLFFSCLVIIHLYPFLKGLVVRQQRIPTVVVVCSLLLAAIFSLLSVRMNPYVTRFNGPKFQECGIYCGI